jgi:hypothetical protein
LKFNGDNILVSSIPNEKTWKVFPFGLLGPSTKYNGLHKDKGNKVSGPQIAAHTHSNICVQSENPSTNVV